MSLRYVEVFAKQLPYALQIQVVDYAKSVDEAAADIFAEANHEMNEQLRDQLTLIAAIRKLHSICSSSFWILYNSTSLLGNEVSGIRAGSAVYSPDSVAYSQIQSLLHTLERTLALHGIDRNLLQGPYTAVLEVLGDGR
jgi:hypothetical protein